MLQRPGALHSALGLHSDLKCSGNVSNRDVAAISKLSCGKVQAMHPDSLL